MNLRGALYLSGVAAVALNAALVWPWLGRVLSLDELATVVTVMAVAAFLAPVSTVGLHAYVLRFLAGGNALEVTLARAAVPWACAFALLAVGTGGLAEWIGVPYASVVGLWVAVTGVGLVASAVLRGLDRPLPFAGHALASQSGALLVLGLLGATGAPLGAALVSAAAFAGLASGAAAFGNAIWHQSGLALRRATYFSIPLIPHLILAVGLLQLMRLLVASGGSADELAAFQFAALVSGGAITVVQGLAAHMTTDALRTQEPAAFAAELSKVIARLHHAAAIGLLAMGLFVWLLLPTWLPSVVDQGLVVACVAIMAPAVFLQVIGDVGSASLMKVERTSLVSLATALGAACAVAVFLLSSHVGEESPAVSAALGVLGGMALRAATSAWTSRMFTPSTVKPAAATVALASTGAALLVSNYYLK